jgi:acyl carrier protein
MVPSAFVSLDALPLTPSGKVDRLSLPEPAAPGSGNGRVAPRTPMEESVAAIWADVLGVDAVGVDDDFFALGGHSLLAAQVVAQVRSDFAVELPMHSLFTMPTVETLAAEIGRLAGAADEDETARLVAKLETLSDDEVERLLAEESSPLDETSS